MLYSVSKQNADMRSYVKIGGFYEKQVCDSSFYFFHNSEHLHDIVIVFIIVYI